MNWHDERFNWINIGSIDCIDPHCMKIDRDSDSTDRTSVNKVESDPNTVGRSWYDSSGRGGI